VCSSRIEKYLSTEKNKNDCLQNFSKNIYDDIAQGKNEIIFIIGDTGSGKSFLLKNIYNEFKN
jgi:chromosomal replication initiation ATPase DnaA